MRSPCYVSIEIDKYSALLSDIEAENDRINELKERILEEDFSPFDPDNICEGLGEVNSGEYERLSAYFKNEDYKAIGELLTACIFRYWEKRAEEKAHEIFLKECGEEEPNFNE